MVWILYEHLLYNFDHGFAETVFIIREPRGQLRKYHQELMRRNMVRSPIGKTTQ